MSSQLQVTGEAKIRDIQGPVVANSGVVTALDGDASQYVRGDGTLADFPTSTGGGSSVSYYLNSSVSQGTIGGVAYRQLGKTPIAGAGTDIAISSNGYVASYITDANDPALLEVPAGNFNCEFYFSVNNNTGDPFVYAEVYKYDGTTFTLLGTSVGVPEYITEGTVINPYYFAVPVAQSVLTVTDRISIRIYVNVDGRTVTLHTENNHLCQVVTTFSKGLISLNNLTRQNQFFATGTSGTDFGISSSVATHTFNLPVASAANTGKLSSTDWSTFNNKQNTITDPITGTGASTQIAYFNSPTSITSEAAFNYDASTNRLGVNTSVPNATIGANAGIDSGYSLLLKNDNANYNGIGFGTDSTYGNLISTEKLGTALARNLTLLNQSGYISLTEAGNLGVNILNPNTGLDIYNGTSAYLWLHTANSGITGTDGVRLALFSNNGANLRNFEGAMSITSEGDFQVITLGAENIRVNSADGKVGIGNPASVPEMLTVNGSIQQSGVLSSLLKTNGDGKIIAAIAGTDYLAPTALSGYVPTSRTITINGTTQNLSADISYTVGTMGGSGVADRVAFFNGTNSITSDSGFVYESGANRLGVNTVSPNATIGANSPTDSNYSLLLKNGDTNYSGIGFSTSTTYGNTIETVRIGTAPSRNLTLYNYAGYISITENGSLGVGILTPNNGIDIYNSTQSQLWLHNNASGLTSTDGVRLALFNNLSANLRNFDGALSLTAEGDFSIITIGTENLKVNSANGFVAIGGPATITSMLTVNGAITQSSVTSALLKTNSSGTIVAAVAGTDYLAGSVISGTTDYIPRFTSSTTIGNSDISQDATFVTLNSRALSAPRARFNTAYDNASLIINAAGQVYIDSRTSRLYNTFNLSSMTNYMHIYDPYSTINANGGFSIGSSSSITLLPSTSIIHFDGVNNRVGIGTIAPANLLHLAGTSATPSLRLSSSANTAFYWDIGRENASTGDFVFNRAVGGASAERMRITNDGDVGIGTTGGINVASGWTNLTANGSTTGIIGVQIAGTNFGAMYGNLANNNFVLQAYGTSNTGNMVFLTNSNERMRITSGGNVLIGDTAVSTQGERFFVTATNLAAMFRTTGGAANNWAANFWNNGTSGNNLFVEFGTETSYSGRGSITYNRAAGLTVFNTTSDYRLKSEICDFNALSIIANLKPKEFRIGNAVNKAIGFIAHELKEYYPQAVHGEKDEIDSKGNPKYQGVDYSQLSGLLVKAVQELEARIKQLENK